VLAAWSVVLTGSVLAGAPRLRVPTPVLAAAVTTVAFSVDAALGAVMEPGSLLNSRPVNGGRWYGFGNVTFAVYATAALWSAGYLAGRLRRAGHRGRALGAVALIGFGAVLGDGWPSMGADFGGVVALTPVVLGLLLVLSEVPLTWRRALTTGGLAVVLVAGISWWDWRRGPGARSHLGDFVQRVIEGDAQAIVLRKAVAAAGSLVSPWGIVCVLGGAVVWVVLFRRVLPLLTDEFDTVRLTALAVLGVAVLGTLVNDGGVSVWLTATASCGVLAAGLLADRRAGQQPPGAAAEVAQVDPAGVGGGGEPGGQVERLLHEGGVGGRLLTHVTQDRPLGT
jgi:hypothetical protein